LKRRIGEAATERTKERSINVTNTWLAAAAAAVCGHSFLSFSLSSAVREFLLLLLLTTIVQKLFLSHFIVPFPAFSKRNPTHPKYIYLHTYTAAGNQSIMTNGNI
jgi:hypothetical protein